MTHTMVQEVEVWYLIPSLRCEIAKSLIKDHGLTQKEVAEMLKISEPAVSQYLKRKRGKMLKFSPKELSMIKSTSKKMLDDKENAIKYLYSLSMCFRGSESLCKVHRKYDKNLPKDCSLCLEN